MSGNLKTELTEEMMEDIELYDFIESPECANGMREYLINKAATKETAHVDIIDRADRLMGILKLNAHTLGCILNGDIVCIDGALFPRDIIKSNGHSIYTCKVTT